MPVSFDNSPGSGPPPLPGPGPCLAVIPARGGSKRVPGKNIRQLCGRPAIAHTIEAALESGVFERVVVSTDSAEIAAIAREYGAEVPFVREAGLADDHTPVSLVTVDALERLDPAGDHYGCVSQLMPNCPLRTADDIRASYQQFAATAAGVGAGAGAVGGAGAQLSVMRFGWLNPWWAMERSDDLALKPLFGDRATQPSQSLPELYCPTGAVWWARSEVLRVARTFHVPGRTGWEITWQHGVDVDTEDDWAMAELLAQRTLIAENADAR